MTWVRFHGELREGEKRGLPRALRFVYMELSYLARPKKGLVELPRGMSDLDAVHDVLGGNKREVAAALKLFMLPLEEGDAPMLRITTADTKRYLEVVAWKKWNPASDSSAERVAAFRNRHGNGDGNGDVTVTGDGDVTVTSGYRNGGEGVPRARGRASDSLSTSNSESGEGIQGESAAESPSRTRIKAPSGQTATTIPEDIALTSDARASAEIAGMPPGDVDVEWSKFVGHHRHKGTVGVDWYAGWQKWVGQSKQYRRSPGGGSQRPDPAPPPYHRPVKSTAPVDSEPVGAPPAMSPFAKPGGA